MRRSAFLVTVASVLALAVAQPSWALPPKLSANGVADFQYGSLVESHGGPATGYRQESKLFYTGDGSVEPVRWWGVFGTSGVSASSAGIWLWELVDHSWVSRRKLEGADAWMKADVLFDGSTAYVSLRDNANSITGNPRQSLLYRIAYAGNGAWGSILGPTLITNRDPESLAIAKDSAGRLWSTFEDGLRIKVGSTSPGGTTFTYQELPTLNVNADDVSSITAFGGDKIGVMWSNQAQRKVFFAWRRDTDPVDSWTVETAYGGGVGGCPTVNGTNCADDHVSLMAYGEEIYAAIKTSLNDQSGTSGDPLIAVLRRNASGVWTAFPVSPVSQNATRPVLVLSPVENAMYVFASRASEVDVWESPFSSPSFAPNTHPVWVKASTAASNPTSTKQVTNSATGTVVLTSVQGSKTYYHNELLSTGPPPPPNTPPTASATTATTNENASVQIELAGTDAETCDLTFSIASGPGHGTLGSITNASCDPGSPNADSATVTYTPAANFDGSDSFGFRVDDGTQSSTPATVSLTVTGGNDPPVASDGSASTSQGASVPVTISAADPDSCDLTFSVETGPQHGSLGSVSDAPCTSTTNPYTDRATITYTPDPAYVGADTFTFAASDGTGSEIGTISINVAATPVGIAFRSASAGSNATTATLTIAAPSSVVAGDVMVAGVDVRGNPSITPPAGWSLVRMDSIATQMRQALYVHVAGGSEPSAYTWSFGKSQSAAGAILVYAGVDSASPIDAHSGAVNDVGSTAVLAPTLTTTGTDEMLIGFFGVVTAKTFTPPAGMIERSDLTSTGGLYPISASTADQVQAIAGATGDRIATASGSAKNIGQLVALRPG